jgi:hypothetical protein
MDDKTLKAISHKLNVLIALAISRLPDDHEFRRKKKRTRGAGDLAHYLSDMGLEAKDIAGITGSPLQSVRTLLTPQRRK